MKSIYQKMIDHITNDDNKTMLDVWKNQIKPAWDIKKTAWENLLAWTDNGNGLIYETDCRNFLEDNFPEFDFSEDCSYFSLYRILCAQTFEQWRFNELGIFLCENCKRNENEKDCIKCIE